MTEEIRTYEITTSEGMFRIDVPASARVSYGPVIGAAGKASYAASGNCLRIWQGTKATEVQRALFQNVISFRDTSLPLQRMAVRKFGTEEWIADDGTWVGKKAELVERAWKSVDEIVPATPTPMPEDPNEPWDTPSPAAMRTRAVLAKREF
jgi:hypothetical protein